MDTFLHPSRFSSTSQLDTNVRLYLVDYHCFPKYEYAVENVLDILKRYKNVFTLSNNGELVPRYIGFYLCKANNEAEFPCTIEDIVSEQSCLETCHKREFVCIDDCLRKRDNSLLPVFVVSSELWESRSEQEATYFICARSGREARAISKQRIVRSVLNNLIIRKETAGQQIETYLEKTIFNDLNPVCEVLSKSIESACYKRKDDHVGGDYTLATPIHSRRKYEGVFRDFEYYGVETEVITEDEKERKHIEFLLREKQKFRKLKDKKTKKSKKQRTKSRNNTALTTKMKSNRGPASRKRSGAPIKFETSDDVLTSKRIRRSEKTETAEGINVRHGNRTHEYMIQPAAINKSAEERKLASTKKTPLPERKTTTYSTKSHKGKVEGPQQLSNLLKINEEVLQTINEETKECLLEECIGVYNMSNVSVEEMPNIPQHLDKVALTTLSKQLFEKCPTVTGIGYRMRKLQITVEDILNNDTAEKYTEIRQILKEHNIQLYEIVPMSPLKTYLTSGDEILVAQKRGSWGCFAKMKDKEEKNETPCGLLSKHVATTNEEGSEILAKKDGQIKKVGHILKESITDGGLDIAAATLSIPLQECETRFKSLRGNPLETGRGKLTETARLQGNKVHMWGAVSKPGKGIITVPNYMCKGMDHTLIQVEDIVDGEQIVEKRFAQPGDSGAVTCADDPGQKVVHPVSMNMGCMNYAEVEKDNKEDVKTKRGKYLTVPLQSGLDQLSRRTGKNFHLY